MSQATITRTHGSITDFITARQQPMNEEQAEAFATELNAMLIQIVNDSDSGFSKDSMELMPRFLPDAPLIFMLNWILSLHIWMDQLSAREALILSTTQVIWV